MKHSFVQPTLKDVAAATGFSTYTVSRALNGMSGVSEETRAVILEAAAEMRYVPNRVAQNLRQRPSTTIGVLTANSANPFYAHLIRGFESVTLPEGFHCVVSDATEDGEYSEERERFFLEDLLQQRVAGITLTYQPTEETLSRIVEWGIPTVFMDSVPMEGFTQLPHVVADSYGASREMGLHFAEHGLRRWLFVGHPRSWVTRARREEGFLAAARECGADVKVLEGRNRSSASRQAVRSHIEEFGVPDAIFSANEPILLGVLNALRDLGLRVPEDVALASYDDFEWAQFVDPAITVVDQNVEQIGRAAGVKMLEEIASKNDDVAAIERFANASEDLAPPRLVLRQSCGCSTVE